MQLNLGHKIRELRHRDGRTQEALAEALGVTSQAVSRWEANGGYPDMEMIPSIANYFHISIDELFGYNSDREERIKDILDKADKALKKQGGIIVGSVLEEVGECVEMLREASEEFPNEPKILLMFAQALNLFGYNKYGARGRFVNESGIIEEDVQFNSQNIYWQESIKAYERTLRSNPSPEDRKTAIYQLTPLYCRMGEYEKAKNLADTQASLAISREMLLPWATVGEEKAGYEGERIMTLLSTLWFVIYQALSIRPDIFPTVTEPDYQKQILLSVLNVYETVFLDGRCGIYHCDIGRIYTALSSREAKYGDLQNALVYFDKGFDHCKEYDRVLGEDEYRYSAPLMSKTKSIIGSDLKPMGEDFWKKYIKTFPENFRNELRKIEKYSECFE